MKKKILVIVAHADDEVLGCGGTISKHKRDGDLVDLIVLTDSTSSQKNKSTEVRFKELEAACNILNIDTYKVLNFEDNQLDKYPLLEIIIAVQKNLVHSSYDIIYTHSINDLNIDHRITNQVALTLFRPLPERPLTNIFTFDVPSSVEYQSTNQFKTAKNYFCVLTRDDLEFKKKAIEAYKSEINEFPHPRSIEYLETQAKYEGSKCGHELAESFYVERIIDLHRID